MDAAEIIDFVLDGLERELELERELGVRTIEVDRALLAPIPAKAIGSPAGAGIPRAKRAAEQALCGVRPPYQSPDPHTSPSSLGPSSPFSHDFVFLHDKPLSAAAIEMMAKIIGAMGKDATTAPVVVAPPLPSAKVYVVLGARALRKFLPGKHGEPGMWVKTESGKDALVTYSPEFFLRFTTVTPAVQKMKQDMWRSLKAVMQRVRAAV